MTAPDGAGAAGSSPARPWLLALGLLTLLRLAIAAIMPLAPDEAYYWTWARALQPGYYDHPPMVALWIAAGTALLGDTPLGIRLLGPLGIALASVLLARAGEDLFPGRNAGRWAAALLNATLFVGVGAVTMTPDTPLAVFWVATVWALARLHRTGDARWWLVAGLLAGAALASKYTALLLGLGMLLWLLAEPTARRWFASWQLWAGGALALLVFSPVIAWNAGNGWASFAKQGGRAGASEGQTLQYIVELGAGQVGFATPLVWLLCTAGVVVAVARWKTGGPAVRLLLALTLPAMALFTWQATGSRVQGNWPAILYPTAAIAAAALLGPGWRRWQGLAVALGFALTLLVVVQSIWAPFPLRRSVDITLARLGGWPELVAEVEAARRARGAAFVAAEEYGLGAQLALRLPRDVPVVVIDPRWAFFDLPRPEPGVTGLMVRSERRGEWRPWWTGAEPLDSVLVRSRHGVEAERYRLFRVETRDGLPPTALLPRPRP